MAENTYQELKLVKDKDIDKEAVLKYISTVIEDAKWREISKSAFETCLTEVNAKLPEIEKKMENAPFNIKKEQCNVKFLAVSACASFEISYKVKKSLWFVPKLY